MRKKTKIAAIAAAAAVFTAALVYGAFSDKISVTNHISMGDVQIRLEEFENAEGKEIAYRGHKSVLPGDTVSKIPRITNLAQPCYVRVKITSKNNRADIEGLSDENLSGISDKWVKKGEYYYYTDILDTNDSTDIFSEVSFPAEWDNGHSLQELKLEIRADAVQAANFRPDFSAMSPWKCMEIEQCVHETDGIVSSEERNLELSVELQGDAYKLIAVPDDFFGNFPTAMPGDSFQDSVKIANTTDREAEIFFSAQTGQQTEAQLELLDKLELTVTMDGQELYKGNLAAQEAAGELSLGKFAPGAAGQMDFTLTVPSGLKNAYALRSADVTWIFAVRGEESAPSEKEQGTPNTYADEITKEGVKTDDISPVFEFAVSFAGSFAMILIVMLLRKVRKKQ